MADNLWNSKKISLKIEAFFNLEKNKMQEINNDEINNIYDSYYERILNPRRRTGIDQKTIWEDGWMEIANNYSKNNSLDTLLPQYYNKNIFRYKGKFYKSKNETIEADFVHFLIKTSLEDFIKQDSTIIELGCGTGHNLVHLHEKYPDINYVGFEYAKSGVDLIKKYSSDFNLNIKAFQIDYYNCEGLGEFINKIKNPLIFTCASLEQVGTNWQLIMKELLKIESTKIINIEPFSEIYLTSNKNELSALAYHHARGYLSGFATFLEFLFLQNKINIIEKHRTKFGTTYHEPYNVLIWEI